MKINQLNLKNFKSVENQSFNFNNGITCFSGDNGEGKSTAIHAILILLFNSYDLSFKDYINWNNAASSFFISIKFYHNGIDWFESFEYSEKSGSKRILRNESTNEEWENSAAINKLNEIIDPDLAKASIVSMENEQNLITTTPAKRREYLKGLYNLEFKEQLDTIAKDLDLIEKENIKFDSQINSLSSQTFEYKPLHRCLPEEIYESSKKDLRLLNAQKGELELKKQKRDEIESNIIKAQSKMRQLSSTVFQVKSSISENQSKMKDKENELDRVQNENKIDEYQSKLKDLNDSHLFKINEYNKNIKDNNEKINGLEAVLIYDDELKSLENKINEINKEYTISEAKEVELKNHIEVMRYGKCPMCGHEVTENELKNHEKEHDDLCKKLSYLANEAADLGSKHNELENNQKLTKSAINALKEENNKFENYILKENNSFEIESKEINHEIEQYENNKENSIKFLKESIKMINQLIDKDNESLITLEKQIEDYNSDLKNLEKEFESINNPESEIISIESQIKEKEETVKLYEETVSYNKWVEEYNEDLKKKEEARNVEVNQIKNKINENNTRKAMIEKAKSMVSREFPSFVISYMVKSLENYTNEFLQKVYPKYQIKIKESKNSLAITYGPKESDVKMASGFEKSAFSLAYMYALGKIQNYGLLIIDEGDGAASDKNSLLFYNTLAKSKEYFSQIFCITHKEVAKDLLKNTYNADIYNVESGKYFKE